RRELAPQHATDQRVAREHLSGCGEQHLEQVELDRGDVDDLSSALHGAGPAIEFHVPDSKAAGPWRSVLVRPPSSSRYRSQAGREFAWIEGLRQIVVRADFQTADTL